jgi:hypothetical protein
MRYAASPRVEIRRSATAWPTGPHRLSFDPADE